MVCVINQTNRRFTWLKIIIDLIFQAVCSNGSTGHFVWLLSFNYLSTAHLQNIYYGPGTTLNVEDLEQTSCPGAPSQGRVEPDILAMGLHTAMSAWFLFSPSQNHEVNHRSERCPAVEKERGGKKEGLLKCPCSCGGVREGFSIPAFCTDTMHCLILQMRLYL